VLGLGRYEGESLQFYRVFGVLLRPLRSFSRDTITVRHRRQPVSSEQQVLYTGHLVVECTVAGEHVELAMSPEAVTGLLAWLESAPPGQTPRPL
jgi:hypothetical protein